MDALAQPGHGLAGAPRVDNQYVRLPGRGSWALAAAVVVAAALVWVIWGITSSRDPVGAATVYAGIIAAVALAVTLLTLLGGWWKGPQEPERADHQLGAGLDGRLRHAAGRTGDALPGAASVAVPVVVGAIPQEPRGFQLRASLLAQLDTPSEGSRVSVVRAVTGQRGIGKTQLAAAFARARIADRWRLVAWVNAETVAGIGAGLTAVATALSLNKEGRDAGQMVRSWLEADGARCVVIFDNVTDPGGLRPYIPAAGDARVIVTTTDQSVVNLGPVVLIDVYTEAEALAFLAEQTRMSDRDGARQLAVETGFLPLALVSRA